MTIRLATTDDLPALVTMGERFLDSVYAGRLHANRGQMASAFQNLLAANHGLVLVAEAAHETVGMLGAIVYAHPMSGELTAQELFWWMNPEHRGTGVRLLRRFEEWATSQAAVIVQMSAPTEHVGAFYERLGFDRIETTYQRRSLLCPSV